MKHLTKAGFATLLAGSIAVLTFAPEAQARDGRHGAFAAGAVLGVLGGAAIANASRYEGYGGPAYADDCYDAYCDAEGYGGPPPQVYYAPRPRAYYAPQPVYEDVYNGGYDDRSGDEIALERFQNRK